MCAFPARLVAFGAALLLLTGTLPPVASGAVKVVLRVTDTDGYDINARVHVKDASGAVFPGYPDSTLYGHEHWQYMGGYFYYQGEPVVMNLAPGVARIEVSKGPEWMPVRMYPNLQEDTSIVIPMQRTLCMNSQGWFSGDTHVHASHEPVDYPVPPDGVFRIADAEGLNMMWILDQSDNFTGGPHPLSTGEIILYYSYEYRNQSCGHVELLGAKVPMPWVCCQPPHPVSPFLSKFRENWNPDWDEAMVLAHPETGVHFFYDEGWPGRGLGREFPVLAATGRLDAYAVASYSNTGTLALIPWHHALSCGYMIPPSAGTDAVLCRYGSRPPGGYRVYVQLPDGEHSAGNWVEGLKAGRVFITNFPLIPLFEVNGKGAGELVELEGSPASVTVQYRVESVLPVTSLEIIHNGEVAAHIPLSGGPGHHLWEGSLELHIEASGWMAGRVTGTTNRRVSVTSALFAHTGAVEVRVDGLLPVSSTAAGYLYDKADSLEMFVEMRGNWQSEAQRQDALGRIQTTRNLLARHFLLSPGPFSLISPPDGDTLYCEQDPTLYWEVAIDPEDGDRLRYWATVSPDSDFLQPYDPVVVDECEAKISLFNLTPDQQYWWRVEACDRGGNCTPSVQSHFSFFLSSYVSSVEGLPSDPGGNAADPACPGTDGEDPAGELVHREDVVRLNLGIRPNPSAGPVRIALHNPGVQESDAGNLHRAGVFDLQGRCLRVLESASGELFWDGMDDLGRQVPSGVYWIRVTADAHGGARTSGAGEAVGRERHGEAATARLQIVR